MPSKFFFLVSSSTWSTFPRCVISFSLLSEGFKSPFLNARRKLKKESSSTRHIVARLTYPTRIHLPERLVFFPLIPAEAVPDAPRAIAVLAPKQGRGPPVKGDVCQANFFSWFPLRHGPRFHIFLLANLPSCATRGLGPLS